MKGRLLVWLGDDTLQQSNMAMGDDVPIQSSIYREVYKSMLLLASPLCNHASDSHHCCASFLPGPDTLLFKALCCSEKLCQHTAAHPLLKLGGKIHRDGSLEHYARGPLIHLLHKPLWTGTCCASFLPGPDTLLFKALCCSEKLCQHTAAHPKSVVHRMLCQMGLWLKALKSFP